MAKILFYYPSNKRSNSLETLLLAQKKMGHTVIVLTTCEKGELHAFFEKNEIATFSNYISKNSPFAYYLRQVISLVLFCKKYKPDVVQSHLQHANFIAVIAQYFISAPVQIFRHHFKFHRLSNDKVIKPNRNEEFFDFAINKLAKVIIVPSSGVYNGMKLHESVNMDKVRIIPYIYDFSKYNTPDAAAVSAIQQKYPCRLLLLMCSRLIDFKRHHIVFPVIKKLVLEKKLDIKMIVLDEGPEKDTLEKYIIDNNLQNSIFMLGYRPDFINYMAAANLLIHPSLTEASNSAVKEMALVGKTAAVCRGIGDFDEYFKNGVNGFVMSPNDTNNEIEQVIIKSYQDPNCLLQYGMELQQDVLNYFNINKTTLEKHASLISGSLKISNQAN